MLPAGLIKAVADVAAFVSADWQDVVPVINATTAVNTVVNSVKLKKGDLLLVANTTYPAVSAYTLAHICVVANAVGVSWHGPFLASSHQVASTDSLCCIVQLFVSLALCICVIHVRYVCAAAMDTPAEP